MKDSVLRKLSMMVMRILPHMIMTIILLKIVWRQLVM